MPILGPNKPLTTKEPVLVIENTLAPGTYQFELVVLNGDGQPSVPAVIEVIVRDRLTPLIPIRLIRIPPPIG
jgi:hypothetical protein